MQSGSNLLVQLKYCERAILTLMREKEHWELKDRWEYYGSWHIDVIESQLIYAGYDPIIIRSAVAHLMESKEIVEAGRPGSYRLPNDF